MRTRNVVLTERQDALVDRLVAEGRFQNASEVLRAGLRLVEDREAEHAARVEAFRAAARAGVASAEREGVAMFDDMDALAADLGRIGEPAAG